MINDIRLHKRPSRPTDPSQNQRLQDRVWDTITTCWSDKPERRCELSVVCYIFSTLSRQDHLVGFPSIDRNTQIRLVGELLYTFLVLPLDAGELAALRTTQEYIYNVASRDGTYTNLSSAEVVALAETFREVSFPQ
jgi:hypothetical protein